MSTYIHSSASHINPRATLALCDACHEHAPAFVIGEDTDIEQLCPSCAVARDLNTMKPALAFELQAAIIEWIGKSNPRLDVPDDVFYAQRTRRSLTAFDMDDEAERSARKAWVASVTADPEPSQADLDAAFMAEFWAALLEAA